MVGRYDAILIQQRISIILNGYKRINYNRVLFLKSVVSVFGEATGVSQGSCDVIAVHLITIHFGKGGVLIFFLLTCTCFFIIYLSAIHQFPLVHKRNRFNRCRVQTRISNLSWCREISVGYTVMICLS